MKQMLLFVGMLFGLIANAQFYESFEDGNITSGILWNGVGSSWQVVKLSDVAAGAAGSQTLRLNVAAGGGTEWLSTQITGSWGVQQSWGFWMGRRAQSPTSSNASYVWLYANEIDLGSPTVDGYRIRLGDDLAAGDKIVLELITDGGASPLMASSASIPNGLTDFGILVRITRNAGGQWSMYTSALPLVSGTGAIATDLPDAVGAGIFQGSVTNNVYTDFNNGYVGLGALHTTGAAARTGAEFDQLMCNFTSAISLPVHLAGITAVQQEDGITVKWSNLLETDVTGYVLEHARDGRSFTVLATQEAVKNDGGRADYQYTDTYPASGDHFYRIRANEGTGRTVYSAIVRISVTEHNTFSLYPNPLTGQTLGLCAGHLPKGRYDIMIMDPQGHVSEKIFFMHAGGAVSQALTLKWHPPGIYYLVLNGPVCVRKRFLVQ